MTSDFTRAPDTSEPTDWWAWQARVRAAAVTPVRPVAKSRASTLSKSGLGVLIAAAVVLTAVGGVAFSGRASDAAHSGSARRAAPNTTTPPDATPEPPSAGALPTETLPAPTTTTASPAPPPAPPAPPAAQYAVERLEFDFVDPDRVMPSRGDEPAHQGRALHTVIRYPAARDAGPFPFVVFAHGYATRTAAYTSLLDALAASGYVVAAPEFPLTSTALPGPVGARDAAEQVNDLSFVIDAVQHLGASDSPLRGVVAGGPVGVVGHSDGGITAAAIGFAAEARDERVGAAVILSGARGGFGGTWFPAGSPALLALHGYADAVNGFSASSAMYSMNWSGSPRYLVGVVGGGHDEAFIGGRTRPVVVPLIADFLRAYLRGDDAARSRIIDDASIAGVLELVASDA
jgi:hypothetical protein